MWGKQPTWGAVRRLVIKYIKKNAPHLWNSEAVRDFMLLGHCEHPEGCLEEVHALMTSRGFRGAIAADRRGIHPALALLLGIAVGFFGASVVRSRGPESPRDWVHERFNFALIMRNLRSTIVEKRMRSLTNACVTLAALVAMLWFVMHMFPFVIHYMRGHHRTPGSNFLWKMLRNAPVVNESLIVVELVLVSVVLVMFTAMLHFTGMFKWIRTLFAKLWYDCFFALHGDPVDNNIQRNLLVEMDILRRDTKASLGGAENIAQATAHREWSCVLDSTMRRRDDLQRMATVESQRIAMSMKHVVGEDAVRRVRDAIYDEHDFISGVKSKVGRLLRGPGV